MQGDEGYKIHGAKESILKVVQIGNQRHELALSDTLVTDRLRVFTVDEEIEEVTDTVQVFVLPITYVTDMVKSLNYM